MKKNTKSLLKKVGAVLGIGLVGVLAGGSAVFSQMDDNYNKGVLDGEANVLANDVVDLNGKLSEVKDLLEKSGNKNVVLSEEKASLEKELAEKVSLLAEFDEEISDAMREDVALALVKEYVANDHDFNDDLEDALSHDVEKVLSVELVNVEVDVDKDSRDLEADVEGSLVVKYEDEDENLKVEVLDLEFEVDGEVEEHSFL